ncbi:MAG: peptidoglycan DD-metalloendopeptidase family protein [Anaerolineaceae bacterium]|jgi:murein DD-endopeptidase MepM/ murein hydrolase activator NlpD
MKTDLPGNKAGKKNIVTALFAWVFTLVICAGLISFLFWQPKIAKSMAAYQVTQVTPEYVPPESGKHETVSSMPVFDPLQDTQQIIREVETHTEVTETKRLKPIDYTVEKGDSVYGIAKKFGIEPESLMWSNYDILRDNPDDLRPGQVLKIPPVDGILHKWRKSDTIDKVANTFKAKAKDIIMFVGNDLDLTNPVIEPGSLVMVPGGEREFIQFVIPAIPRGEAGVTNSAFHACDTSNSTAIGTGSFIWPTDVHTLSGNDYWSGHLAIDLGAGEGAAIYAADSGVVTWAGPISGGYGNMIYIDHGNGYGTLYAHLSAVLVRCGQDVYQGNVIGRSGNTGNSFGAHLHFEVRYGGGYVNPWSVLP